MVRFNSDVVFIDMSGQVRAVHGDLTLRANEAGGGHIIVGSGVSLRPEVNCDALDAIDLGQIDLRWDTLYACSGNFLQRPTVNGSGVLLQGDTVPASVAAGVDTINGLSGVVFLASVSDAITITENGQTIEFSGLFDNVSGILLDDIAGTLGSGVVNLLNGISGLVTLSSSDGSILISPSGNDLVIEIDPEILENLLTLSGISETKLFEEAPGQSTTSLTFVDAAQLAFPLEVSGLWRVFYSMQASSASANKLCQFRVLAGKGTLEEDIIMDVITSFNVGAGDLPFAGAAYVNLPKFGNEGSGIITVDFRFADTGGSSATLELILLEATRLGAPSGV